MIHGLGSSPLALGAACLNALWGAADLRARFQVWHMGSHPDRCAAPS